ncbi:TPA: hypothetical protein N0F65_001045 [Lagenidium giganteum]|uniref:Uncharacterized protein n=1 Tax=Lagenidium giganteum TaxID=4803 RepID=A0AAV2YLA7_9STRA|nr:TPA: hypothetical protein N0F65_001045 [Lagenidium giganteum]
MHSGLLTDQRVGFHVAEIFADMYAEYIAIGCCSSILYFYWDHPKYRLSALIDANMTTTTSHGSNNGSVANVNDGAELKRLLMLLAWQVSLELVVDFTSCVLEEVGGISFQDFQKYKLFAALVFGSLAVININMSSILYIRPEN